MKLTSVRLWIGVTVAITAIFGRLAVHKLPDYRPVSNDEVELMSVAYKIATQGVLGSDIEAGMFGADQHYLQALPMQSVMEALSFRLIGPGVLQARLVSVMAALTIVWTVGWLAFRWYGLTAAVICELLLVAWRSNLTAAPDGLPLLGVARTARYDVLAVAAAWLAIAALDAALRKPRPLHGFAAGFWSGVAALSQFFGAFVLPMTLLASAWNQRSGGRAAVLVDSRRLLHPNRAVRSHCRSLRPRLCRSTCSLRQ